MLITSILLGLIALAGCSPSWSIIKYSYIENPSNFVKITSVDSVKHYYKDIVRFNSDMWCVKHNQWEMIKKK